MWHKEDTMRDQYARMAMNGILSNSPREYSAEDLANWSYSIADAMLKARKTSEQAESQADSTADDRPCNSASTQLKIGKLMISQSRFSPDHVYIGEAEGGEGGDFRKSDLAPVLEKFYSDNF